MRQHLLKRLIRRGQVGQTIVILAFGFIVLLGFVGIVTDISLMFVRYTTLRRAADAAAVAAAGQLRRAVPTTAEIAEATAKGLDANGLAYARNVATVNLAARQFIEFYGLSPSKVVVDTCQTTNQTAPDPDLKCDTDRKLVKVTAQVDSPTVFLRLLGWGTVRLEASAISETATLDVVLIMDVSESMLNETSYKEWEAIGYGARFVPPRVDDIAARKGSNWYEYWPILQTQTHAQLYTDPDIQALTIPFNPYSRTVITGSGSGNFKLPPVNCRVRFYPSGVFAEVPDPNDAEDRFYSELSGFLGYSYPPLYDGFVPQYNFYGCCNNPLQTIDANGNFDFSGLICQPFKQARDATLNFIKQIDFARGDRVAVVTFDRKATLLKPTHEAGKGNETSHMIGNLGGVSGETRASDLIRRAVGVGAEASFYLDTNDDGLWDGYAVDFGVASGSKTFAYNFDNYFNVYKVGEIQQHPVFANCPYATATLPYPFSLYSTPAQGDPKYRAFRYPDAIMPGSEAIGHPNYNDTAWLNALKSSLRPFRSKLTYEFRASCAGTNIGAALRQAGEALSKPTSVYTPRTNGSVWVMVLLGDGAAAASDPAMRNGSPLNLPNPYTSPPETAKPVPGDYGAFGLCPYGTTSRPGELLQDLSLPFCSDKRAETRNFCDYPVTANTELNANPRCVTDYDVDDYARDWADFIGLLDPYPGLKVGGSSSRSTTQLPTIFTIGFGLRFRDPGGGTIAQCKGNMDSVHPNIIMDCLGEELLRYIADVGDNFQIDTDYQQSWRGNQALDFALDPKDTWGARGPCEGPLPGGHKTPEELRLAGGLPSDMINPLPPGENCGNYFNATNGLELQQVFDEIASRMFTRITR